MLNEKKLVFINNTGPKRRNWTEKRNKNIEQNRKEQTSSTKGGHEAEKAAERINEM